MIYGLYIDPAQFLHLLFVLLFSLSKIYTTLQHY